MPTKRKQIFWIKYSEMKNRIEFKSINKINMGIL